MMPEFREIVQVAQDKIGDQDSEKFTAYQQRMITQAVSVKASEVASNSINKVLKEQTDMATMNDGEATGENYWMESPMKTTRSPRRAAHQSCGACSDGQSSDTHE